MSNLLGYLVFKRLRVEGANSISSPLTYGFPAISAFLGATHQLSRKLSLSEDYSELSLGAVLICAHECDPQVYRTSRYADYSFNLSRNPILRSGKTASISEEGKAHLLVTLAVEVYSSEYTELEDSDIDPNSLSQQLFEWIQQQPLAGGRVRQLSKFEPVKFYETSQIHEIHRALMSGFVLMDAAQDLAEITAELQTTNPEACELDALIEVSTLHHEPDTSKAETRWSTRSAKSSRGWLVPIPVGYQGISDLFEPGSMQHSRNPEYPAQFVECLYSLGKWQFPSRLEDLSCAFWRYEYQAEQSLFLTTQNQPK